MPPVRAGRWVVCRVQPISQFFLTTLTSLPVLPMPPVRAGRWVVCRVQPISQFFLTTLTSLPVLPVPPEGADHTPNL